MTATNSKTTTTITKHGASLPQTASPAYLPNPPHLGQSSHHFGFPFDLCKLALLNLRLDYRRTCANRDFYRHSPEILSNLSPPSSRLQRARQRRRRSFIQTPIPAMTSNLHTLGYTQYCSSRLPTSTSFTRTPWTTTFNYVTSDRRLDSTSQTTRPPRPAT